MKNKTNKLRNAFFIAIFCLLNAISYGQTKEETISWLEETLSKYLTPKYNNTEYGDLSITPCEMTINFTNSGHIIQATIPTDGLTISDEGGFSTNGERISKHFMQLDATNYLKSFSDYILQEGETDLRVRVKKALDHLATFCPKKKETF